MTEEIILALYSFCLKEITPSEQFPHYQQGYEYHLHIENSERESVFVVPQYINHILVNKNLTLNYY